MKKTESTAYKVARDWANGAYSHVLGPRDRSVAIRVLLEDGSLVLVGDQLYYRDRDNNLTKIDR